MTEPNARIWTIDELSRVHPLPEGWAWGLRNDGEPVARADGREVEVHDDVLMSDYVAYSDDPDVEATFEPMDPPVDVVLAVILASKGRDSLAAMAAEVEALAPDAGRIDSSGFASGLVKRIADMLRRGVAKP